MFISTNHRGRTSPFTPAAILLLVLCLLPGGAQGADVPRYVVGDVLDTSAGNLTHQVIVGDVDTQSLSMPYYTLYDVEQNAGRWEIPGFWNQDQKVDEGNLVENLHAHRIGHVDPVLVVITDETITGGDTLYYGLSLSEALGGMTYWVEPPPGEPLGLPNVYLVGDILGNVSDQNRGAVVSSVYESDGMTWYRVYFDAVRSGDRWILDKFYNNDMGFTESQLGQNDMRRVAHADPHTVIINDPTTNTGEIGWYRLSLAEFLAGKGYDHMGYWYFNTGDILGDGTASRYIVGNATTSDTGPSHYTLYEVVNGAEGWRIPTWASGGIPLETPPGVQLDGIPYDLVDHTDPHFAIVTDASVVNGLTWKGLSLGEILEGTPGYPPESLSLPVPPSFLPPTDPDGDGLYDDVNGNGRKDFADVVLYFNQMTWIDGNEPMGLFDYNGNGRIDFADVVWLFNNL